MFDHLTYIDYIEITGVVFGFICVILTAIENIWCWPTGIVSVIAYIYFYYHQTLYVNVFLHIFFLVACVIGWYQWLYGGENKTKLLVTATNKKHLWKLAAITLGMFLIFGVLSDYVSNDKLPYLDALLASMSFTAQWMMNHKLAECWIIWIVTDIIYAGMHFQMHNYPSFLLYVSYIITATSAYYLWKRSIKKVPDSELQK